MAGALITGSDGKYHDATDILITGSDGKYHRATDVLITGSDGKYHQVSVGGPVLLSFKAERTSTAEWYSSKLTWSVDNLPAGVYVVFKRTGSSGNRTLVSPISSGTLYDSQLTSQTVSTYRIGFFGPGHIGFFPTPALTVTTLPPPSPTPGTHERHFHSIVLNWGEVHGATYTVGIHLPISSPLRVIGRTGAVTRYDTGNYLAMNTLYRFRLLSTVPNANSKWSDPIDVKTDVNDYHKIYVDCKKMATWRPGPKEWEEEDDSDGWGSHGVPNYGKPHSHETDNSGKNGPIGPYNARHMVLCYYYTRADLDNNVDPFYKVREALAGHLWISKIEIKLSRNDIGANREVKLIACTTRDGRQPGHADNVTLNADNVILNRGLEEDETDWIELPVSMADNIMRGFTNKGGIGLGDTRVRHEYYMQLKLIGSSGRLRFTMS